MKKIYSAILGAGCFILISLPAIAAPVTFGFKFEITVDRNHGTLTGPLFTSGTRGTGTATFIPQTISDIETWVPGVNGIYSAAPFKVSLFFNESAITLIQSSGSTQNCYGGECGIIVQDISPPEITYDMVQFVGLNGIGGQQLFSRLAIFAPPTTISDYNLSTSNVEKVGGSPRFDYLEISAIRGGSGIVAGSISDFHLLSASTVPEPSPLALFGLSLAAIILGHRRRKATSKT